MVHHHSVDALEDPMKSEEVKGWLRGLKPLQRCEVVSLQPKGNRLTSPSIVETNLKKRIRSACSAGKRSTSFTSKMSTITESLNRGKMRKGETSFEDF
jgi:hypothetical protein